MKRHWIYVLLAAVAVTMAGCGGNQSDRDGGQVDSFYNAGRDKKADQKQEGKEYQSTGDQSLLDVKLPERLDNQRVQYKAMVVYFNKYYRVPNCVAYELTRTQTSMADSRDAQNRDNYKFEKDGSVSGCPDWWEYKESGYTRGHMAPAMDMRWGRTPMTQCFMMTNICPQDDEMNDGEWRHVEEAVHKWSRSVDRLIVFTGPVFSNNMKRIGKHRDIAVPEQYFKVIYSPSQNRAIAFVMPNEYMPNSWTNYATTIDRVETLTGYDFLSSLDDSIEDVVESKENIKDWPKYYPSR